MIAITQETLESYVPAFRSSEHYIFDSLQGYILEARERTAFILGDDVEERADGSDALRPLYVRLICYSAARRAVPGLDLILTENGFGVVNSQNVAPASSSRVEALLKSLSEMESSTTDTLIMQLLQTSWKDSPKATRIVSSLLWCPTLLRTYGITMDGHDAYAEEFRTLQPTIASAEEAVRKTISPELHAELLRRLRNNPSEHTSIYTRVIDTARQYIAAVAAGPAAQPARSELLKERLLRIVEEDADNLPEYKSSATYRAHHFQHYENRREDNTFFFS